FTRIESYFTVTNLLLNNNGGKNEKISHKDVLDVLKYFNELINSTQIQNHGLKLNLDLDGGLNRLLNEPAQGKIMKMIQQKVVIDQIYKQFKKSGSHTYFILQHG
ncbi:hypothetical protein PIROE2DRAFT_17158, partial [Piromyces sp. E2]